MKSKYFNYKIPKELIVKIRANGKKALPKTVQKHITKAKN